jgi:hypothetical protein
MTEQRPLTGAALDAAIDEAEQDAMYEEGEDEAYLAGEIPGPELDAPEGTSGDPAQLRETIRDWMADLPDEGREFLREALEDALEYREPGDFCADCGPDELCIDHAEDLERADAYRERLGMLQADIGDDYQPEPLPRQLGPAEAADALAPLAAELPDGTPHADPFLGGRGWQARDGVYVRQAQAQMEAG